jgi:hypothetical protein
VILAAIQAQKDILLLELADLLLTRNSASFAASTVWRFLVRHAMTLKKQRTQSSRNVQTSREVAELGSKPSPILIPRVWSSSMSVGLKTRSFMTELSYH